jgi:hypothetical protein
VRLQAERVWWGVGCKHGNLSSRRTPHSAVEGQHCCETLRMVIYLASLRRARVGLRLMEHLPGGARFASACSGRVWASQRFPALAAHCTLFGQE